MSGEEFKIEYKYIPHVTFPSASGMRRYLENEAEAWSNFLGLVGEDSRLQNIPLRRGGNSISGSSLANAFETLIGKLGDPANFNRATTQHFNGGVALPPPSDTLEAQLILGLHLNGRHSDAISVYLWFASQVLEINQNANQPIGKLVARGHELSVGAYAAAALPFRRVSSQKLAGAARSAAAQVQALGDEVAKSQEINANHASALAEQLADHADTFAAEQETWKQQVRRAKALFLGRERKRREAYGIWAKKMEAHVSEKYSAAIRRVDALERSSATNETERKKQFDDLIELFHAHLQLRRPVQLWEGRAKDHRKRSLYALVAFGVFTVLTIAAGALIPFCFGDYIAASFFTQVCDNADPPVCTRAFSAKGPLTVGGILTIMSLLMWAIRLQYRVYLSERHLALDASEKQAFAETYIAMKEGADVGSDNEAIVLASLFRPTQDGIIKDDDSTLDLSAAALIAKQLGRVPG